MSRDKRQRDIPVPGDREPPDRLDDELEQLLAEVVRETGVSPGKVELRQPLTSSPIAPGKLTLADAAAAGILPSSVGKLSLAQMLPKPSPAASVPRSVSAAVGDQVARQSRPTTAAVQLRAAEETGELDHEEAERGIGGSGEPLPHHAIIQAAFGRHDLSDVRVHRGDAARRAGAVLGARAYTRGEHIAFAGQPDLWTAAHEAAHVIQQRGGVSLTGGFGEVGDRYERHADQVADTVVRGESAEPLLDRYAGAPGASSPGLVQRAPFSVDASMYITTFQDELVRAAKTQVKGARFGTGSSLASWKALSDFGDAAISVWGDGFAGVQAIRAAIRPQHLEHIVDRSRKLDKMLIGPKGGDPQLYDTNDGEIAWFHGVGVAVGDAVIAQLTKSLQRIMPRYVTARMQAKRAEEERLGECITTIPQASPADVLTSHPVDALVVRALIAGDLVDIDAAAYDEIHPDGQERRELRPVEVEFLAPRGAWFWVRVTNLEDPTAEEVARQLYGSTEDAHKLTDASPLFGLGTLLGLQESYMSQLVAETGVSPPSAAYDKFTHRSLSEGFQPGNLDPAREILAGPLAEEAALNQAGEGEGRDRLVILQDLRQSHDILKGIAKTARVFGLKGGLEAAITRLDERSRRLGSADPGEVQKWDAQAKSQKATLSEIAHGLNAAETQYQGMRAQVEEAAQYCALPSAIVLPQHVRRPLRDLAEAYVRAAEASDLTATAEARLEEAKLKSRLVGVEIMEAILVQAQNAISEAASIKRETVGGAIDHAAYDVDGLKQRQEAMRERVSALRTEIIGGGNPGPAIKKLFDEIAELQLEVEMVGNMDTLDETWQVLEDEDGFIATVSFQDDDIERFKKEAMSWHSQWKAIYAKWKSGDRTTAKADLEALRTNKSFQSFLSRAYAEIKDIRFKKGIAKLAGLLVITIATMGAGSFATGFAAGLELGSLGTLALTAGVEAFTFTFLQTVVLEENRSAGKFFGELAFNFAMFGSLRRFSMAIEATKLAPAAKAAVELTGQAVMLGAWSAAREEVIKYVQTGEHLTSSEIADIAVEGLIMFVTMAIVARTASPVLKRLEGSGRVLGTKFRVANRSRAAVNAKAEAQKGTRNIDETIELLKAERESMQKELEAYRELERVARNEGKDSPTLKKAGLTMDQLVAMRQALGLHAQKIQVAELMLTLEPIAPNHYAVPLRSAPRIIGELGGRITSESIDPVTGLKTTDVVTADGTRMKLTEKVGKDATAAELGLERARANLDVAEAQPGSGVGQEPGLGEAGYFDNAVREAGEGASATQILDRLSLRLPDPAREGLEAFRAAKGDETAHAQLSGKSRQGKDSLVRFLTEQGMSKADKSSALKAVADARLEVARAKLEVDGVLTEIQPSTKAEVDKLIDGLGNKPTQEALDREVAGHDVVKLTGDIGEAISRRELAKKYRPEDGFEILSNVEVVEPVPGYKTVGEYKSRNPDASQKDINKLRQGAGKIYRSITEIDTVVLKSAEGGGREPVAFEQVKTGKNDSHRAAQGQNTEALRALRSGALAFEQTGKATLGNERTSDFRMLRGVTETTRGLAGKGFDSAFDFGVDGLTAKQGRILMEQLARLLIKRGVVERTRSAGEP